MKSFNAEFSMVSRDFRIVLNTVEYTTQSKRLEKCAIQGRF